MTNNFPILSLLIFLPLIGAALIMILAQGNDQQKSKTAKSIALVVSFANFIFSLSTLKEFDQKTASFQMVERISLSETINFSYHLGLDGISIFFVPLTALLIFICIVSSWNSVKFRLKEYMSCFLILESCVIGVFSSLNFILFYLFFEAVLIPMFLIIGVWGGENRIYAALKFFLYTLAGSILLLIAILFIYSKTGTMDIALLNTEVPKFSLEIQKWLWIAFFASFAVKVPMFPFHTWLPDAHVQAPTAGSVILAGILLKMGGYGFLRFSLPMLPAASQYFADFVFILSIIGVVYASLVALVQTDMKKLIAYSSVAHMAYVTAGIFAFNLEAIEGSIIQMISHGLVSSALFLCVGVLYDRMHTKEIAKYGGVTNVMPKFAVIFLFFVMASVGLPGTSGFAGEFVSLLGIFKTDKITAALMSSGVVFGAAYMLLLFKKLMYGEVASEELKKMPDLTKKEIFVFVPLVILTILFGVQITFLTNFFEVSIQENIINHMQNFITLIK